jgi:hypothetical protein
VSEAQSKIGRVALDPKDFGMLRQCAQGRHVFRHQVPSNDINPGRVQPSFPHHRSAQIVKAVTKISYRPRGSMCASLKRFFNKTRDYLVWARVGPVSIETYEKRIVPQRFRDPLGLSLIKL